MGRYSEAADAMLEISSMKGPPERAAIAKEAARVLRTAPAKAASPQDLPAWMGSSIFTLGPPAAPSSNMKGRVKPGSFA